MTTLRRLALLIPALVMLAACGGQAASQPAASSPAAKPSQRSAAATGPAQSIPASTAADALQVMDAATTARLTCTESGSASSSFQASSPGEPPAISSASATNNDFTLVFAHGTPAFEVQMQSSARFIKDPSGQPVTLTGSFGVKIVLRGFRGGVQNYTGPTSLTTHGPLLRQVAELGDFEGVISWGAGLSSPGCASVSASGSTLTFHFIAVNGKG